MPMFGASLSLSSSTATSSAAGQGDFNLTGSGNKYAWLPWVVIGAVGIIAIVVFRRH